MFEHVKPSSEIESSVTRRNEESFRLIMGQLTE